MFGNKREKIKIFVERLKDYHTLKLKIIVMLKNKNGTLEGVISHLGKDFIEVSDGVSQFISIPFQNIDAIAALAKEEWKSNAKEEKPIREQPIQKKVHYMKLGEVDY